MSGDSATRIARGGALKTSDKLMGALGCFGILLVLALGVPLIVTVSTPCPDNARFLVFDQEQIVVPEFDDYNVLWQYRIPEVSARLGEDDVSWPVDDVITWEELRNPEGPYSNYSLPSAPEWDGFVFYADQGSMWRRWIFGDRQRWTERGTWLY